MFSFKAGFLWIIYRVGALWLSLVPRSLSSVHWKAEVNAHLALIKHTGSTSLWERQCFETQDNGIRKKLKIHKDACCTQANTANFRLHRLMPARSYGSNSGIKEENRDTVRGYEQVRAGLFHDYRRPCWTDFDVNWRKTHILTSSRVKFWGWDVTSVWAFRRTSAINNFSNLDLNLKPTLRTGQLHQTQP